MSWPEATAEQMERVPVPPGTGPLKKAREYVLAHHEIHPFLAASAPTHEELVEAGGLLIRCNPLAIGISRQTMNGTNDPTYNVPINSGRWEEFETDVFAGRVFIAVRGAPNADASLFAGKRRLSHVVMQGRFKHPVRAGALMMGQEFIKEPPEHLKSEMLRVVVDWVLRMAAKRFANTIKVDVERGHMANASLPSAQLIQVSRPGEEPQEPMAAVEDMRLWEPALADATGAPLSSDKRRRWCDDPANLEGRVLTPDHVWTFHIYQHLFDFSTYKLSVGGLFSVDLVPLLMSMPLQLSVRDWDSGGYMWSALLWHERLVKVDPEQEERMQRITRRLSRTMSAASSLGGAADRGGGGAGAASGDGGAGPPAAKGWRNFLSFKK